jgi:hypothetical protein
MRGFASIAWLLVLALPAAAFAATVRGVTRDAESGQALGFVTVQVFGRSAAGDDVARGLMTLADGSYSFASISPGRYTIRFARVGYTMREDSLLVADDREYTLDVALSVAPIQVEGVAVEADRLKRERDEQTGFVSVEADRLASLPGIAEGDPIRVLELIPGVQTASDFSSALYVRGGGPDQTLVLLDRTTVYNPTHAFGFFSTFNADAIGDVSLYKGAYPAEHGGRLGAVLDVRTREALARRIGGKAGISTIASRVALEGPAGRGSWAAGGRRTHLEPMLELIRDEDTEVPDYYFYDVNGKLAVPTGGGRIEVSLYTGHDDLDFLLDEDTFLNLDWGNTVASGAFVRALGEGLIATARLSYSDYASHSTATAFTTPASFENGIRDYTAAGEVAWVAGPRHTLTAGLQASRYEAAFSQVFNAETLFDYRRESFETALFAEDRWTPWAETVADAGLRVRYLDDGGRWLFEPRLALAQRLAENLRAKLGGGIYHQYLQLVATEAISAADFYVPIDASTDVGRSWQVTGGVDWRWSPAWLASVEGYYTGLSNLVLLDNSTTVDGDVAVADDLFYLDGTGYATGVELFLRRDRGPLTGWVGYTLGWTRRTFPEVNEGDEFPPKYDRRHDVSAALEYARGPWRFTGAFVYATGQAFTPVDGRYSLRDPTTGVIPDDIELLYADKNSARLLPYNRLDVGVARDFSFFGARAEWLVEVFNLYSRRNEWFVQYQRDGSIVDVDVAKMLPIIPSIGVNVWF